jgi:hypothetical protein
MADAIDRHREFDDDRLLAYALGLDPDPELEAALEGDEELGRRLQAVQADLDQVESGLDRLAPAPDVEYGDPAAERWAGLRPHFSPPPERRSLRSRRRVLVPALTAVLAVAVVGALALNMRSAEDSTFMGDRGVATTAESAADEAGAPGGVKSDVDPDVAAELALFETGVVARAGEVSGDRQRFTVVRVLKGSPPDELVLDVVDEPLALDALTLVLLEPIPTDLGSAPGTVGGEDTATDDGPTPAPAGTAYGHRLRELLGAGFITFGYGGDEVFARPLPADVDLDRLSP